MKTKTNKNNKSNRNKTKKQKDLFSDNYPEYTVKNTGFKNVNTALNTIKIMTNRDITYQFQVINTMYNRAKSVLEKTKDKDKKKKY